MYTYTRFKTSKSALTILLIGLALVVWGNMGLAGKPDKPDKPGKPGSGTAYEHDLPVTVTFQDDFVNARIKSDGNGEYSDGTPGVTAFLGRRCGQFVLSTKATAKGKNKVGREVSLDFTQPVPPEDFPPEVPPFPEPADLPGVFPTFFPESVKFVTAREGRPGFLDLRAMTVGDGSMPVVGLRIEFCFETPLDGEDLWWITFGELNLDTTGGGPDDDTYGDLVTATRVVDDDPLTPEEEGIWTIETSSVLEIGAALHSVDWNGPDVYYGNYDMPFKLTIETLEPQAAPPAFSVRSKLTRTWGRIKTNRQ